LDSTNTPSGSFELSKRWRVEARLQQRARVVLLAASGRQNKDIAVEASFDWR
jgi:DNA-binding CsgD family transcriptional regulator